MHGRLRHEPVAAVLAGCHVVHLCLAMLTLLEGLHICCAQGAALWDRGWRSN